MLALIALVTTACGGADPAVGRQAALERRLDDYVIERPVDLVMAVVAELDPPGDALVYNGVSLSWSTTSPGKMKSSRRALRDDSGDEHRSEVSWYECEMTAVTRGTQARFFEVKVTSSAQGPHVTKRERRTDLELDLIAKFDARAADRLEANEAPRSR